MDSSADGPVHDPDKSAPFFAPGAVNTADEDHFPPQLLHKEGLQLTRKLGSGGFGDVYAGAYLGSPVAIKAISGFDWLKPAEKAAMRKTLKAEVNVMRVLRNPNVVAFYDLIDCSGTPCVLMELCEGGSFWDVLNSSEDLNFLTLGKKLSILRQAALGMVYLHACSPPVIHRDLKAMNILLDHRGHAKVSDFGVSRIQERTEVAKTTGGAVGTVSFMAPELLDDQATYNEKVDVYAFAMVIFEAIAEESPWGDANPGQVVLSTVTGIRPALPPHTRATRATAQGKLLCELMKKCWSQEAKDRPAFTEISKDLILISIAAADGAGAGAAAAASSDVAPTPAGLSFFEYVLQLTAPSNALAAGANERAPKDLKASKDVRASMDFRASLEFSLDGSQAKMIDFSELEQGAKAGSGANGEVFYGRYGGLDVAIKRTELSVDALNDPAEMERLTIEAAVMSRFTHPNIVQIYGACVTQTRANNQQLLLVMAACDFSLKDYLDLAMSPEHEEQGNECSSPMSSYIISVAGLMKLLVEVAGGMAYLHSRSPKPVIHRDLKPGNVLLDGAHHDAKVCDFGEATMCNRGDGKGGHAPITMTANIGTPVYMAPELMVDERKTRYTPRVDVYSFGILAWHCLYLQRPYDDGVARREFGHTKTPRSMNPWMLRAAIQQGLRPLQYGKAGVSTDTTAATSADSTMVPANANDARAKLLQEQGRYNSPVAERLWAVINSCWDHDPKKRPDFNTVLEQLEQIQNEHQPLSADTVAGLAAL
jgi:serine/threonine protein kinase